MNKQTKKAIIAILGVAALYLLVTTVMDRGYMLPAVQIPDLGSSYETEVEAGPKTDGIYGLELFFSGELSADATVLITYPGAPVRIRKVFKAGKINDRYYGEWYFDRFLLTYEPQDTPQGKLTIRYRFVTM